MSQGGCFRPVTDLAETWYGDSGQPKKLPRTHIFAFGCVMGDIGPILRRNMEKLKNCFLTITHFHLGLTKSLCIFGIKI